MRTQPRQHPNHSVWCLMRTKARETSVSKAVPVHAPIWHLADADPDLRACTPQPLLPIPTKSAGNTPNATCTTHRESWSPWCGGKAAFWAPAGGVRAVTAQGCTCGHGQHQLIQPRGSLGGSVQNLCSCGSRFLGLNPSREEEEEEEEVSQLLSLTCWEADWVPGEGAAVARSTACWRWHLNSQRGGASKNNWECQIMWSLRGLDYL